MRKNDNIMCARCRRLISAGEPRIKEGIYILCMEHKKKESK